MTGHIAVFVFICVASFIAAPSAGQRGMQGAPRLDTTAAGLSAEDIQTILTAHNDARKLENAAEMPDLVWAQGLAASAQNWTDECVFAHQPSTVRKWGENIGAVGNTRSKGSQLAAIISEWVAEKKHNKNGTFEECCSFKTRSCCHYTQVIWADSLKVGCGYTVCDPLQYQNSALNSVAFLACYYSPSGNRPKVTYIYDWKPYKVNDSPPA